MTDTLFRFSPNVADLVNSDLCIRHRRLFPVMTTCGLDPPSAGSSPNSAIHEATACGGSSESASTVMTKSASRHSAFHAMLSASALPSLTSCKSSTVTLAASQEATSFSARATVSSVQLFATTTIRSSRLVCRSSDTIVFSIVSSSLYAGMIATTCSVWAGPKPPRTGDGERCWCRRAVSRGLRCEPGPRCAGPWGGRTRGIVSVSAVASRSCFSCFWRKLSAVRTSSASYVLSAASVSVTCSSGERRTLSAIGGGLLFMKGSLSWSDQGRDSAAPLQAEHSLGRRLHGGGLTGGTGNGSPGRSSWDAPPRADKHARTRRSGMSNGVPGYAGIAREGSHPAPAPRCRLPPAHQAHAQTGHASPHPPRNHRREWDR